MNPENAGELGLCEGDSADEAMSAHACGELALALPAELRGGGAEIFVGIDGDVLDADLVVQMGRGGAAGGADVSDDLSAVDVLAGGDGEAGEMSVAGGDAVSVVEFDEVSVTVHDVGEGDDAIGGGMDWACRRGPRYRGRYGMRLLR